MSSPDQHVPPEAAFGGPDDEHGPPEHGPPERGPRPTWTQAIGTNRQMVGWYRSRLEQPRYASLRTRRGRRALTAAHLGVSLGLAANLAVGQLWPGVWSLAIVPLVAAMLVVTGFLHAATFGMLALGEEDLDERQRAVRGEAHRRAHRISVLLLFIAFLAAFVIVVLERVELVGAVTADPVVLVAGFAALGMLVASLPAYVLAWSRATDDPDMDEASDRTVGSAAPNHP